MPRRNAGKNARNRKKRCIVVGILLLISITTARRDAADESEKMLIRIKYASPEEKVRIDSLHLTIVAEKPGRFIETYLSWAQVFELHEQQFDLVYIVEIEVAELDSAYHTPEKIQSELIDISRQYSSIMTLTSIFLSASCGHWLLAQKTPDPKMVLEETVFDFGEVVEGKGVGHVFKVRNK